ncbi:MAG TPA: class I SAM-dependent methyltransferase [Acidothermaceae bacterium]
MTSSDRPYLHDHQGQPPAPANQVGRRRAGRAETTRANRGWWDAAADDYQDEHGGFLRDTGFVWCPEGLDEADAQLLGPTASLIGKRVLEVGCGAAQCARWLAAVGARPVAFDLSRGQLRHARALNARTGVSAPLLQADAQALPFADECVDLACSAYGGLPFVADSAGVLREVFRVLRDGGRFVFSVSHPFRWALPDDPGPRGLTVTSSYFDRTPYVESDDSGVATYVEHHRTLGDWVREIAAAGFRLTDLVEPEWPAGHDREWGGWSPLRGKLIPGTAIFRCEKQAG